MTDNMHPADQLHALREQNNELERRIKEAHTLLLELSPGGGWVQAMPQKSYIGSVWYPSGAHLE